MPLLRESETIRDTYVVDRLLGDGSFGEVYRVEHRFLGRQAMKVFKRVGMTLEEIEETLGEAALLSRIGHPNIVRVFDANVFETRHGSCGYFTMEYVPGGTLAQYWRSYQRGLMPVSEAVTIIRQVCGGLAVAHGETPPIVHRDVKPQNILVGYDGSGLRVRASDFGLAKHVNPLTLMVSARGTLSFKPPEAFDNMDSCAADIWAVGTTLYLLLTDTLPHPSLNERDLRDRRRFLRPLQPASSYNPEVGPELDAVIARCLARDPEDRYSNAADLLVDLNEWQPDSGPARQPSLAKMAATTKAALGARPAAERKAAEAMVDEALKIAKNPVRLTLAADLLEEAINKDPSLRERYGSQLKLWRRGVCM